MRLTLAAPKPLSRSSKNITLLNDNGFEKGKNDISKVSFVSNGAFRLATQKGRCPEKEGSQKRKATPDFA